MSLTIDNNDAIGVELYGAPETLDFWDVCQESMGGYDFFTDQDDATKADELDALIADKNRITRQASELATLLPKRAETNLAEYREALDEIERKVKKLMGKQVNYTKTP